MYLQSALKAPRQAEEVNDRYCRRLMLKAKSEKQPLSSPVNMRMITIIDILLNHWTSLGAQSFL